MKRLSYILEQYKIFRSKETLKCYNFFSIDKELNWFYYFMKHRNINKPIKQTVNITATKPKNKFFTVIPLPTFPYSFFIILTH